MVVGAGERTYASAVGVKVLVVLPPPELEVAVIVAVRVSVAAGVNVGVRVGPLVVCVAVGGVVVDDLRAASSAAREDWMLA